MNYNFDEPVDRNGTQCLKYDGKKRFFGSDDILPLWVADMDFRTPDFIARAIQKRSEHEIYGYTLKTDGFTKSAQNWLIDRYQWKVEAEDINFTPGVVSALNFAVLGLTNPGDKVIVQPPVYFPFFSAVTDHGRELSINPLKLENGQYSMDLNHFESLIDNRTKLFFLCSPHNPGGRVWTRDELKAVGEICRKHHITILSDEIHSDLVYQPHVHTPMASISDELADITITSMAPSKTFNIAGLSSSMVIIRNEELRKKFMHLPTSCHLASGNLFGLTAFEAAYTHGSEWLNQLLDYLWENIKYTGDFLQKNIPKIKLIWPEGTFLLWLDFRDTGFSDEKIRDLLIHKARIGFNHGPVFGIGGEGFQRMNIGCTKDTVKEALNRMAGVFA